jgi:two-component system sensor histidine kinase MprB
VRRRFGALPLRSRLALLTALAVAVAVAVCATAAWFIVRGELMSSLDGELREATPGPEVVVDAINAGYCQEEPAQQRPPVPPVAFPSNTLQVVFPDGRSCVFGGTVELDPTDADIAVAQQPRTETLHNAAGSDGQEYRVLTRHLGAEGIAVSVARPLEQVNGPLRSLVFVLAAVAAAGAIGSAGVGVGLARAGLRPVDRLTEAAEHIARTEDLSVRLPVSGESDDEIARLSRSFNSMTAALASSRELQQQLIADAGHELRTPLTSLRTNIELLARSEETGRPLPEAERRLLLASVTDQLGELATLIGDLQELSRPATASARLEVVGLHEVTRRALRRARLRAPGLPIDAELEDWYVRAEPAALERAVVNLLDNAIKFGGGGGAGAGAGAPEGVRVSLRGGVLCVRDHGPGVAAEDLPHVFERFWRSPTARGLPGSGLGLSIVARTARACGGEVTLRPAADGGGGTEAVLTLPGAPVPPPDEP